MKKNKLFEYVDDSHVPWKNAPTYQWLKNQGIINRMLIRIMVLSVVVPAVMVVLGVSGFGEQIANEQKAEIEKTESANLQKELAQIEEQSAVQDIATQWDNGELGKVPLWIVAELNSGNILKVCDENVPLHLASLTKLGLIEFLNTRKNQETFEIKNTFLPAFGDTALQKGDTWTYDELVSLLMVSSDNGAAFTLCDEECREEFGLWMAQKYGIRVSNPAGLDFSNADRGSIGTINAVINMTKGFVNTTKGKQFPQDLAYTKSRTITEDGEEIIENREMNITHTYPFINEVDENVLFVKTGYTDIAGGHVVAAIRSSKTNQLYFVGVFEEGYDERHEYMRTMLSDLQEVL